MTLTPAALERLRDDLGILLARHDQARDLAEFRRYADDPVGFMVDVLHMQPWTKQTEIAYLVRDHRLSRVRSAQGIGKTYLAAGIILWWVYARGPSVVVALAATERQVREQLWREVRRLFVPELPGTLYTQGLEIAPDHFARAFATTDAGHLTGYHHERLLVVVDEAHGLDPVTWEAVHALATGEHNKVLAIGNPGPPSGRWYELNQTWPGITVSALDHPNVVAGREVIPGAVSREFIEDIAREFGPESGVYRARVLGEFSESSIYGLVERRWIEAAVARHRDAVREGPMILACDVARYGMDRTVLAVRQGNVIRELVKWSKCDLMQTVARLEQEGARFRVRPGRPAANGFAARPPRGLHVIDGTGLGAGVADRLRQLGYDTRSFIGAEKSRRFGFANSRTLGYWIVREELEAGRLALPPDAGLRDQLLATEWGENARGEVALLKKDRLPASPDEADAVSMAVWARGPEYIRPLHYAA